MNTAQQINDILRRLRAAREARSMSQQEVADYFDWSANNVGFIENGKTNLKMEVFLVMCEIYGVDPGEIITGKRPRVVNTISQNTAPQNGHTQPALTPQEKRMLQMVRDGLSNHFEMLNDLLDGLEV